MSDLGCLPFNMKSGRCYRKPIHLDGFKAKASIYNGKIVAVGSFAMRGRPIPLDFIPFETYLAAKALIGTPYLGAST